MKKKNNNSTSISSKLIADNDIIYIGNSMEKFEKYSEVNEAKKLHQKFIISEEDDNLSENWAADQEEQNQIHNNFSENQLKEKKRGAVPHKH